MPSDKADKQNVLDTADGTALKAFYISRYAGDEDGQGNPATSLGKSFTDAARTGRFEYKSTKPNMPELLAGLTDVVMSVDLENPIILINGTFGPLYLAKNFTAVHGGTQQFYPTYDGTTHQLPPATPHPVQSDQFLLSVGVFCYATNWINKLAGIIEFSTKKDGAGNALAVAFYKHPTDLSIDLNATADLSPYGGSGQTFYDVKINGDGGKAEPLKHSQSSHNGIAISAAARPDKVDMGIQNAIFIHVYRPNFEYTVQDGDTLGDISQRFYGSTYFYRNIARANASKVPNPSVIGTGLKLTIPALT